MPKNVLKRLKMISIIITILCTLPVGYFLWTLIHEFSHLLMARSFAEFQEWSIKPYPHFVEINGKKVFRFASFHCILKLGEYFTKNEKSTISLAPRIMDIIAAIALPFATFFSGIVLGAWLVLWGCGLLDLFVGSLGISEESDLKKAAKNLDISPWWFRIVGMGTMLISVVLTIIFMVI